MYKQWDINNILFYSVLHVIYSGSCLAIYYANLKSLHDPMRFSRNNVVVGGTRLLGNADTEVIPEQTDAMLERAYKMMPSLKVNTFF